MSPNDWSTLKVVDLRAELSNRGLPTKGVKAELIARLNDNDAAQAEAPQGQDEAISGDTTVARNDIDLKAAKNDSSTDNATSAPSPAVNAEAAAAEEIQPVAEVTTTSDQKAPATEPIIEPQPADIPSASDTPVSEATGAELPSRKRRSSRSRTPPPSAKRARQERELEAGNREDVVDFETGDIAESANEKEANGVAQEHVEKERIEAPNQTAQEESQKEREGSADEAYQKRVAIAGSFDGPEPSSQAQTGSVDVSGEEAYLKRVAIAEALKAPSPPTNESLEINDKDEDVKMTDAIETSTHLAHKTDAHGVAAQQQADTFTNVDDPAIPSTHQPTAALYIRELMRPLKPEVMEQYIVDLMTPEGQEPPPDLIEEFYIDQIRTHAFIQLASVSAAMRVRAALHNQIWPNESNRKPLWVDFVPLGKVKQWITEESEGSGAQSKRWEVAYEQQGDEMVAVHRTVGSNSKPFSKPPPTGPAAGPTYPGIEAAPRGPRGRGGGPRLETPGSLLTQAHPRLSYTPLNDDIARRRVDNMRSFYSKKAPADLGKNYHRFTFENVDSFVDRGVEVFIGIRPPHREKEHQDRLRREQSGTAGTSSANESRRDDFRPRAGEDRFPRYGDNRRPERRGRNRGFRGGSRRYQGEDPYRYRPGY